MKRVLLMLALLVAMHTAVADSLMDATQFEGWQAATEQDRVILSVLRDALFRDPSIDVEALTARVDHGDVWIGGEVATVREKQIINEIVHRVDGVGEIDLTGLD